MSNYTKNTNFTAKDNLTSGDPAKVIKGSEFDTEFNAIETAVNSKANKNNSVLTGTTTISQADIDTLQIDSVTVTATSTELNTLDGYTGDVTDFNKLADVTATAAELNLLDGVTSTTAELNILDGVTATASEINVTDGLTASTSELNVLDGATLSTDELNLLDGVTATTTELNILDGVTSTTAEINKLDGFTGTVDDLNYAKDLRATGVTTTEFDKLDGLTATTAELNITDGLTATTTELNYTDGVTSNIQTQLNSKASATASPTIALAGDATGAVTLTNLGNAMLTVAIEDDSHNHIISNVDGLQTALDGKATSAQGALADTAVQPNDNVTFGTGDFTGSVDVTGTVTADGLTVDGSVEVNRNYSFGQNNFHLKLGENTADSYIGNTNGSVYTATGAYYGASQYQLTGGATALSGVYSDALGVSIFSESGLTADSLNTRKQRMLIDSNGDVSFYEDTGTTAKMVWDSSAEKLSIDGVGTALSVTGPTQGIAGGNSQIKIGSTDTASSGKGGQLNFTANTVSLANYPVAGVHGYHETAGAGNYSGYLSMYTTSSGGGVTEHMRIDSSGNVGIGTASPATKLHVYGASPVGLIQATSGNSILQLQSASGGDSSILRFGDNIDGDVGNITYTHSNNAMAFTTGATERARIDSSGNLLVGTTVPVHGQLAVLPSSTSKASTHFYSPVSQPLTGSTPQMLEGIVYLDTVSAGNRITLPFTSQGSANVRHLVELRWYSEEFNTTSTGSAGRVLISVRSLNAVVESVLESSGNFTSVTTSGMDLQINIPNAFTGGLSNYEGVALYYKILTSRPNWVEIQNLALN